MPERDVMMDGRTARFVHHFVRAYPRRTLLMVVLMILAGLAEGIGVLTLFPLLELAVQDGASPVSPLTRVAVEILGALSLPTSFTALLALVVVAMALKGGFLWLAMRQVGFTISRVATDLRLELIRSLMRARWSHFAEQPAGHLASAVGVEAMRASWAYRDACAALAGSIQVAMYAAVVIAVSPGVALLSLLVAVVVVFAMRHFIQEGRAAGLQWTSILRSLTGRLMDLLPVIKPIKAMDRERHVLPMLEDEARRFDQAQRRLVAATEHLRAFQEPLLVLMVALLLYTMVVVAGEPVSVALILVVLLYRLMSRVNHVQALYQAVTVGESAFWSVRDRVEAAASQPEPDTGEGKPARFEREIQLASVSFSYGDDEVLSEVSLRVPRGGFIVLTGPSGAGKTTIADLLTGLLTPTRGDVLVDGVPLREIDFRAWRRRIGYVPQETLLFHRSIAENVTLGHPEIGREAVEEALESAGARSFIDAFAEGIERVVGEHGSKLSGGQRRRITLARALAGRPQLLILDEPTSGLDPETAAGICETLRGLSGGVTILAISHQTDLLDEADLVYRVEGGRVLPVTTGRRSSTEHTGSALR